MISRDNPERLRELRAYLAEVKRACESDARLLKAAGRPTSGVESILKTAIELEDGFSQRYAIVGDSNAGKSLIVGAIIGLAEALPVNPFPETGNVTILRIRNSNNVTITELGPYRLSFLTREQAQECLRRLQDELVKELERLSADLPASEVRQLSSPNAGALPALKILNWVFENRKSLPATIEIYNRVVELCRFCSAWHLCGEVLAGKQGIVVPPSVAEEAMVLPKDSTAEILADFDSILNAMLASRNRPSLDQAPDPFTADSARLCYPLVRDIRVDVRVPNTIWDLRTLHVDSIDLYDFPGLRASRTAARDRMLIELAREADRIHAWLLVVNAADLTGTQATQVLQELDNDRVLAVANLFDKISLTQEGYLRDLKGMVADDAPTLTQTQVVERVRPLEPLARQLPELAPPERTALVSALLGLAELDEQPAFYHQVLTQEKREDWKTAIRDGQEARAIWRRLPPKIEGTSRETTLASWLTEYAREGGQSGIVYLRQLLAKHAAEQGIGLLVSERRTHFRQLEDDIQSFLNHLDYSINESLQEADSILKALEKVEDTLREQNTFTGQLSEVAPSLRAVANYKLLSSDVFLQTSEITEARNIIEIVRDEILMRVYDWPIWSLLMDATGSNGFVEYVPAKPSIFARSAVKTAPPMRAGEVFDRYKQAYLEVEKIALAFVKAALMEALDRIADRLAPLRATLTDLPDTASGEVLLAAFGINTPDVQEILFEQLPSTSGDSALQSSFWMKRFPFLMPPDANGEATEGPYFGWAPQREEVRRQVAKLASDVTRTLARNSSEHQNCIFRLRHELCETMEAEILRDLTIGLQNFREVYAELINEVHTALSGFRSKTPSQLLDLFRHGESVGVPTLPDLQLRKTRLPRE
jgi:hypothetical protein